MSFILDLKIVFKGTILNHIWHSVNGGYVQVPSSGLMFLYFFSLTLQGSNIVSQNLSTHIGYPDNVSNV